MAHDPDDAPGRPLRVVHLVENLEVGGLERLLVEFARHADRSRFRLRFAALGRRGHLAAEVEALGWPVHAFGFADGLRPRAVPVLAAWLRRNRAAVLHTHSSGPHLYGTVAARLAGVRTVVMTRHHGPDINNSRRAMKACTLMTRWVDRVICVADDGLEHSLAEGVARPKLLTVRNGIDLDRFPCRGPDPRGPAVVVARLTEEKGVDVLLRAVPMVVARDPSFHLEIAGDGPCRTGLEALAGSLGVADAVHFLGRVDDVAALLGRASVVVLPSRKEGISLALLEAMARGLPVVATRVGGTPEVVQDGETGYLVPPEAPEALAAAVLRLRTDPERARAFGRAGRSRVEASFDVRATVAAYEALYERGRPDGGVAPPGPVLALCGGGHS